jgi:hypothetical protein
MNPMLIKSYSYIDQCESCVDQNSSCYLSKIGAGFLLQRLLDGLPQPEIGEAALHQPGTTLTKKTMFFYK